MATATVEPRTITRPASRPAPAAATKSHPVLWWAILGGAFIAFAAYLIVAWVTGPYFHSVSPGPVARPGWMATVQTSWQAIGIPLAIGLLYFVLIRPWRRDGRPTTDGLMALACMALVIQDPWSSYVQHWFTYNAALPNMGSWVNEIPGWVAYGSPGHQVAEPLLWSPFMYCYAFFAITVLGCVFMRALKARWPQLGPIRLVALCALVMMGVDFVLEGVLFLPLGFFSYAGGHWALFPDAYHKFPAHEAVFAGAMFAALSSIRYFVDDRGNSLAERGIDAVRGGELKKTALRFAAIYGAFSLAVLALYNVPTAIFAANSTSWPADVQKRSYLMDGVCGEGTGRACPGPETPIARGDATVTPREVMPFSGSDSGPFNGGFF
jgi:hypothetical protein